MYTLKEGANPPQIRAASLRMFTEVTTPPANILTFHAPKFHVWDEETGLRRWVARGDLIRVQAGDRTFYGEVLDLEDATSPEHTMIHLRYTLKELEPPSS